MDHHDLDDIKLTARLAFFAEAHIFDPIDMELLDEFRKEFDCPDAPILEAGVPRYRTSDGELTHTRVLFPRGQEYKGMPPISCIIVEQDGRASFESRSCQVTLTPSVRRR